MCVEVPERALLDAPARSIVELQRLKELGVRLSIDGAGAGLATFDLLRDAPVDEVKINAGAVRALETGTRTAVSTLIDLARGRDLHTVGQGVETDGQLRALRDLGCDAAQGYFFAGPQPAEVIDRLVDPDLRFLVS
jgi:EAL domain-containing protein (putative c-di-GMP-specific phosphodiesterase class I)